MMLRVIKPKEEKEFLDGEPLHEMDEGLWRVRAWNRNFGRAGDGDASKWYKYRDRLIRDLRRSAVRTLVDAGVLQRVTLRITGHKTRAVFDSQHRRRDECDAWVGTERLK